MRKGRKGKRELRIKEIRKGKNCREGEKGRGERREEG